MMDTLNLREDATLGALFFEFAKIGLCGIGSMLLWTRRVIVDERHWMSEAEFAETLSLGQFLPPAPRLPTSRFTWGQNFAGLLGRSSPFWASRQRHWPLVSSSAHYTYLRYPHPAVIQKVLGGISAAAAGLLIATGIKMLMPHCRRPAARFFAALAFAGIILAKLPLLTVLV